MKISIDLHRDPEEKELVPLEEILELIAGCHQTIQQLGKVGGAIEAFRIQFVCFGGKQGSGPKILVHFSDPLDVKCTYGTDFRFIGAGGHHPSRHEIASHLCAKSCLPRHVAEHFGKCQERLRRAGEVVREVTTPE